MAQRRFTIIGLALFVAIGLVVFIASSPFAFRKCKSATVTVKGMTYNPLIGDDNWGQKYWYEYRVGDKVFVDTIIVYNENDVRFEGDIVRIEYLVERPEFSRVLN